MNFSCVNACPSSRNKWPHILLQRGILISFLSPSFSFSNHFLSAARHPKTRANLTNESFVGKSMTKSEPPLNLPLHGFIICKRRWNTDVRPTFSSIIIPIHGENHPVVCPLYSRPTCHFSLPVFHSIIKSLPFIKSFSHVFNYSTKNILSFHIYIYFLILMFKLYFLVREEGKLFLCNYRVSFKS